MANPALDSDLPEIYKRYQNDAQFRGLVVAIMQYIISAPIDKKPEARGEVFDALRLADRLIYEREMEKEK